MLDAEGHLPNIVPAVVLAAAALEVLISAALDALAPVEGVGVAMWVFINNRGDYRKEPSVVEQYDVLLTALAGRSLKMRNDLWEVFRNLREARNSLMHDGSMSIGGRPVTRDQAYGMIIGAKAIAAWIEELLPAASRRPSEPGQTQLTVTRSLLGGFRLPSDGGDAPPVMT
jgi:hypothetical protein